MLQPIELKSDLPIKLSNDVVSTTTKVWNILVASKNGDPETVKKLADECPELLYAQYNYTPPIHFAVREGHIEVVKYLLDNGAHDPSYKNYPFHDNLQTIAHDRGYYEIESMLNEYAADPSKQKFKGDNGEIDYKRTQLEQEFEKAVHRNKFQTVQEILREHPEFAKDETYFWSEGILLFAAKENNQQMMELLMNYGARVPKVLKWAQFYYFERYDSAVYLMKKGMDPNTMSWHHVTLLHDMAQKGFIDKAELLIKHGADINAIDEEYQATPLGLAARWGQNEMVEYLLQQGADPNLSGASWSTPLEWALKKGLVEVEKILQKSGAN
ncbi:MAG TPA: ankyrin repeat domain-containing protein [Chitinophagaceae bacterium]|nr:ankyrin repeat domain-containing protein [Chitinophagaceae bacterium]